jgi:hypothetical protein
VAAVTDDFLSDEKLDLTILFAVKSSSRFLSVKRQRDEVAASAGLERFVDVGVVREPRAEVTIGRDLPCSLVKIVCTEHQEGSPGTFANVTRSFGLTVIHTQEWEITFSSSFRHR